MEVTTEGRKETGAVEDPPDDRLMVISNNIAYLVPDMQTVPYGESVPDMKHAEYIGNTVIGVEYQEEHIIIAHLRIHRPGWISFRNPMSNKTFISGRKGRIVQWLRAEAKFWADSCGARMNRCATEIEESR